MCIFLNIISSIKYKQHFYKQWNRVLRKQQLWVSSMHLYMDWISVTVSSLTFDPLHHTAIRSDTSIYNTSARLLTIGPGNLLMLLLIWLK